MRTQLPCYRIFGEYVEAFLILAIEFPDIGIRLCGPDGLRHGVRQQYLKDHAPHPGGYYLRLRDGYEFFIEPGEFEMYYRPVKPLIQNVTSIFRAFQFVKTS